MQNLSSAERIKKLVELEGKGARNLVTWSVPVAGTSGAKEGTPARKRSHSNGRHRKDRTKRGEVEPPATSNDPGAQKSKESWVYRDESGQTLSEREEICKYYSVKTQRQSRVTKSPSRLNLHARYWSYLFDNLHRAVDEIYRTCEADESTVECQEVIMTLEVCHKDFEALIRKIQLFGQSDLESKSSNLAWEIRKTTSPGKPRRLGSLQATPSPPPPSPLLPPILDHASIHKSQPFHKLCHTHHRPDHTHHQSDYTQDPSSSQNVSSKASVASSPTTPTPSKLNSARVLDFKSVSNGKNSPSYASSTPAQTSASSEHRKSKVQEGPTWADRVKGVNNSHYSHIVKPHSSMSEPSTALSASSENGGKRASEKQLPRRRTNNNKESATEETAKKTEGEAREIDDGWETVTRGRAKSASLQCKRSNESGTVRRFSTEESTTAGGEVGDGRTDGGQAVDEGKESQVEEDDKNEDEDQSEVDRETEKVEEVKLELINQDEHCEEGGRGGGGVAGNTGEVREGVAGNTGEVRGGEEDAVALKTEEAKDVAKEDAEGVSEKGGIEEDVNKEMEGDSKKVEEGQRKEDEDTVAVEMVEEEVLKSSSGGSTTSGEESQGTSGGQVDQAATEKKVDSLRLEALKIKESILYEAENEPWSWSDALAVYNETESYRSEVSWADRCDSPPGPMSDVLRSPGRAIHLHQRLSSPSRKRPLEMEESRRLQQEKQAKAQLQRSKLQEEKALKSKVEADKIREAKESRDALARQRREALEDKLQRADMLRESHLQERVRRAQEEEAKVSEISFINTLEAQNRKLEVQERYQGREARLQELQDERQRRKDEQLAKEEAALERRRTIEVERHAKLLELDQRRREQDAKAENARLEREKAREEAAKEKAKERERKLMARNIALVTSTEELERKLQLKQDESSRRYDQQLEQKKKLATGVISSRHASVELAPRVDAYKTKKWCTLCNVSIVSDVYLMSHLRGRKHQDAALALLPSPSTSEGEGRPGEEVVIVDAPEEHQIPAKGNQEVAERLQAGKKRARKLRQRLSSKAKEFESSKTSLNATYSKQRSRLQKALREVNKQVDAGSSDSSSGCQARLHLAASQLPVMDRALGEICRALLTSEDKACFAHLGGVASILKMLMLSLVDINAGQWTLSLKTFSLSLSVLLSACVGQPDICHYLVTSNKVVPLVDLALAVLNNSLVQSPQGPPQASRGSVRSVVVKESSGTVLCGPILHLLASVVSTLAFSDSTPGEEPGRSCSVRQLVMDIIGYMVNVGLMDKLRDHFTAITGPIEDVGATKLILGGLNLLVATTAFMHTRVVNVFSGRSCDDPTLLTTLLRQTELVGLMQLLYAILLSDGPPRHSHIPPPLTQHTLAIATATIKVVNNSAILDMNMVQTCLGAEGISLEFRHIVSYLLWYCSHHEQAKLLHELILAVGYFSVLNHDNQVYLQSGRSPTLLQLLCRLPFQYFSNPSLSRLLYPSLISACYRMEENKAILEEEISCKLLVTFLKASLEKEREENKEDRSDREKLQSLSEKCIQVEDLSSLLRHRLPREHWEEAIVYFS